jgi:hypothetical protein
MASELFPGLGPAAGEARRRGRPRGSVNKRSVDLARYIEAQYGGMTPGQQSAAVALVTAKELKAARGSVVKALADKAAILARELGCTKLEAWREMRAEREGLMPYVHQKRPQALEVDAKGLVQPVIMLGAMTAPALEGEYKEIQGLNGAMPIEVSQVKSHE